jgi:hydrogenase maturation factor HypF (carbamoyltransferase family)
LPAAGDGSFHIQPSELDGPGPIFVSPDVATRAGCLAELFDPTNRRCHYPFLNCTNCGPRLTIVTGAPYDRQQATMSAFTMCAACRAEYEDPTNRRFHAQPTCCPKCGPQLHLLDREGPHLPAADPVLELATALQAGRIGAVKGRGSHQLTCDARSGSTVAELRRRKQRDEKPFAVMIADIVSACPEPIVRAVAGEAAQGTDPARIARRFHSTMVDLIAAVCDRLRRETGLGVVVLSGGVSLNVLLTREVGEHLKREGFRVCCHRLVPPNDGGLSLGQLAIAAQQASLEAG